MKRDQTRVPNAYGDRVGIPPKGKRVGPATKAGGNSTTRVTGSGDKPFQKRPGGTKAVG